jgi:hypothetical protein
MSHSLNRTLSVWEDVLAQLRRKSVSWRGNPLSDRDRDTFTEAVVMCALHLTDMSSRYGGIGSEREIIAWAYRTASLDVSALGSFLSDAVTLLRGIAKPTTSNWFKRQLREEYPFTGIFLSPIREVLHRFLVDPNPGDFTVCYQFLSFLTHLTLLDCKVDLEGEYEELEQYLRTLSYPESLVTEMNSVMRDWMRDFSISEESFFPSHGPGAVAELSATAAQLEKYRYLGTDQLIDYVFSKHAGFVPCTFFPSFVVPEADSQKYFTAGYLGLGPSEWERQSKVVFVPKSMKTRRTISKEPASLQFFQQGVSRSLDRYIHAHPYLKSHINLRDQAQNATLAIESSGSGEFATIDLSSASDTVTTALVKSVFRGTPVYPFLVALRSRTAELPSGKVLELAKYAPMGSALCFPVETLIFACAVECTVRRARRQWGIHAPVWRVYGDDIIVHDSLFWDTMQTLKSLGFIPNASKSFSSPSRFRESCGGEGYDGCVVTPMKISRRFYSAKGRLTARHAPLFQGLVSMANAAADYEFSLLRAWIIRVLLGNSIAPPLFSRESDGAIHSPCPDNYRAIRRWNLSYQRWEVKVAGSGSRKYEVTYRDLLSEDARYYETLRLTRTRSGDMHRPEHLVSVPYGSGPSCLRAVWVEPDEG